MPFPTVDHAILCIHGAVAQKPLHMLLHRVCHAVHKGLDTQECAVLPHLRQDILLHGGKIACLVQLCIIQLALLSEKRRAQVRIDEGDACPVLLMLFRIGAELRTNCIKSTCIGKALTDTAQCQRTAIHIQR